MYKDEDFEVIDLREIIEVLKKRIIPIIVVPVVFAVIGALVSIYLIKPVYESSTTLIVNQNKISNEAINKTDVDLSKSLIYTYAEMAKSNTILENTKKKIGLTDVSRNSITVSSLKDTMILKVTVRNTDPKLATEIANTLVQEFTQEIIRITKTDNVAVVDYAMEPTEPVKPNKLLNTAIAGILGEMLILFLIFIIEYLDSTLKTEKDIEKYLELPIIGSVPNLNQRSFQLYGETNNKRKAAVTSRRVI